MNTQTLYPQSVIEIQNPKIAPDLGLAINNQQLVALEHPGEGGSSINRTDQPHTVIDANPLAASSGELSPLAHPRKIRRNGRIACLPRVYRDMVNRMLWNAVPYKNIVAALGDQGYKVTERNVSSWATGGYLEWRLEQEAVLQNGLDQDHLVSFLRRDDAAELPEVGLQAAATRLSQVLLQKLAHADDPEAHLDGFSRMIDLLCRLNREIATTQQRRDNSRRALGPGYDPSHVKETDKLSALETERFYSDPPDGSKLLKPAEPPFLPPDPTDIFLAEQIHEKKEAKQKAFVNQNLELLKRILQRPEPGADTSTTS
jgi:hypothetical protein